MNVLLVLGALWFRTFVGAHVLSDLRSCDRPDINTTCNWYPNCLERVHPCGPDGYALGYGFKYCTLFEAANASVLSPRGLAWRDLTLVCLQEALLPLLNRSITCPDILSFAYETHPICYTQSGVCHLPASDWRAIEHIICQGSPSCDGQVWQAAFWKQLFETLKLCI